jgi:protein-S-isoprenylcysteine O-methyltransferase Ste14
MSALADPFFWALLGMFGVVAGNAIQGSRLVGRSTLFGFVVVATVTFSRVVLVLPMVEQPRFDLQGHVAIGTSILIVALALMAPLLRIRPLTQPDAVESLRTTGVFGLVRHPGYLANVLWGLGWAVAFRSTIGMLLTPVWFAAFLLHALIEEEALERTYGARYRDYQARVRGRMLPLPLL